MGSNTRCWGVTGVPSCIPACETTSADAVTPVGKPITAAPAAIDFTNDRRDDRGKPVVTALSDCVQSDSSVSEVVLSTLNY